MVVQSRACRLGAARRPRPKLPAARALTRAPGREGASSRLYESYPTRRGFQVLIMHARRENPFIISVGSRLPTWRVRFPPPWHTMSCSERWCRSCSSEYKYNVLALHDMIVHRRCSRRDSKESDGFFLTPSRVRAACRPGMRSVGNWRAQMTRIQTRARGRQTSRPHP